MRYGLKERLVGAIALIALAVIFLPFLLQPPGETLQEGRALVPAPPPSLVDESEARLPPVPPSNAASVDPVSVESAPPREAPAETSPQRFVSPVATARSSHSGLALAESGQAEAWAIQVASFGEQANAVRLVTRLEAQGYRPYWRSIRSMAVVFVGPYLDQEEARRQQDRLLQDSQLRTLLVRYVPVHEARAQGSLPEQNPPQ
ncbi:SPOR domain-containing protein [Marinospirillum sp. MEB164]|uniref:SPOR domain-containing protein n=1 Tax=Marinospirillum alkalitolerans TaxID=3123374 RepID=A0ABW8PYR9_9GAMM